MIYNFNFIEKILLRFNVIPHPLLDALTLVIAGRALQVSVKMGLVEALDKKARFVEELAQDLKISKEGIEVLIDNLEALGYVERVASDKYLLSKRGKRFFSKEKPSSMLNTVLFSSYVFDALVDLEKNVKKGGPGDVNLDLFTPEQWAIFNKTMIEIASSNATEIANLLPKNKNFKKLLDVGGSHGLHAIEYCKKVPNLDATILDLKPVEPYANQVIKEKKMTDRVKFRVGDFLKDDLGEGFDVVFAFNVIHGLNLEPNSLLTKKIYNAMNKGGMYVILDQIKEARGKSKLGHLVSSAQGLMLFNQAGGRTYTFKEVDRLMREVGFKEIKMKTLRAPGNALIIGYK